MKIGPNFADALRAAGLGGLPITWAEDGTITGRDNLTAEQAAILDAVIAAHDPARSVLLAYLPARRYQAEIGGADWNGWNLPTDDRSQSKYLAELAAVNEGVRADGDPWKFDHGFEALSNQQVRDMAVAARNHVLACFGKEAEVALAIAKGIITTTAQIDAAFEALS